MQQGLVFVHFFALLTSVAAATLSREWSRREFPELPGSQNTSSPRCLRLLARDSAANWFPVPPVVALDTTRSSVSTLTASTGDWYAARALVRSNAERYAREPVNISPGWGPAGRDSLDITIPGFPESARLRISSKEDTSSGRLVIFGDVSIVLPFNGSNHILNWPPVEFVQAVRIPCLFRRL
jgi:hypothetical protein